MRSPKPIRICTQVDRPFEGVSDALRLDGVGLFQRATSSAKTSADHVVSTVRAPLGPLEVGVVAVVTIDAVGFSTSARGPALHVGLSWEASDRPALFPTLSATITARPLEPSVTELELVGEYRPPLGALGGVIDAVFGHRFAEASIQRFVDEITEQLRIDVSLDADAMPKTE